MGILALILWTIRQILKKLSMLTTYPSSQSILYVVFPEMYDKISEALAFQSYLFSF